MKSKWFFYKVSLAVAVIAAVLLVAPFVKVWTSNGWTCAYTGSQKGNKVWFWGVTTDEWVKKSPIEKWLDDNGRAVEHKWVKMGGTEQYIIGRQFCCGRAPAIDHLLPELQTMFIEKSTKEEILNFLGVLRNGTPEEANQAVDEVSRRMIEQLQHIGSGTHALKTTDGGNIVK